MRIYNAIQGQSIYDVCLQTYGSLDYLFKLMQDNAINGLDERVVSGQTFIWDDSLVFNQQTNAAFSLSDKLFSTAVPEKIVPPILVGDLLFGGVVAYVYQPGDPGYIAGEQHGLVTTLADIGSAAWGCYPPPNTIGGTSGDIGAGAANTAAIMAGCGQRPIAASVAADYSQNGYDDWHLPSAGEISKFYINAAAIGGLTANAVYYTSTEAGAYHAFCLNMAIGGQIQFSEKNAGRIIRPVRYF